MSKRPCSVCAKTLYVGTTSALEPICQPCRAVLREQRKTALPEYDCVVCGEHVVGVMRGHTATKCTTHRHWKRTECSVCKSSMYASNRPSKARNVYCSAECVDLRRPGPSTRLNWRQCPCGAWTCTPRRKYCSAACFDLAKPPAKCNTCGGILSSYPAHRVKCDPCKEECARLAHLRRRHGKHHRSRARHHGVEYEPVNPFKVYERDKWCCGICGLRVDSRIKWPNQMCASLDHIVPMARGGPHSYANTQCSHWLCNVLKSDRGGGEQLLLVG